MEIKIIIEGPTDTGKSALARAIHRFLCKNAVDAGYDSSVEYAYRDIKEAMERLIGKHTTVMISERNTSRMPPLPDPVPKPDHCIDPKLKELLVQFAQNCRLQVATRVTDNIEDVPGFDAILLHVLALQTSSYNYGLGDAKREQQKEDEGRQKAVVKPEYLSLYRVLEQALNQAQNGKGAERHKLTGDTPFERQRMQTVCELVGSPDGMVYQAIKKLTEGLTLPTLERQTAELLGVINYVAGIVIYLHAHPRASEAKIAETLART